MCQVNRTKIWRHKNVTHEKFWTRKYFCYGICVYVCACVHFSIHVHTLCNAMSSLINTVTPPACDPCKQDHCEPKTETVTVSSTPVSCIAPSPVVECIQTEYMMEPLISTTTVIASQSPTNDDSLDQSQKSGGSSTAWMVVAIVFLVIALTAIALSIIMGYLLHKKTRAMENSSPSNSGTDSKKLVEESIVSRSSYIKMK